MSGAPWRRTRPAFCRLPRWFERLEVSADDGAAAFLLLAARPLREPVVQYGPFVMNSRDEIEQAVLDYQNGLLV
jgi:redox-sensitive bicupin YhaK (pirin superfamily)